MVEDTKEHYVYGCYVDGELKYIGKGKGSRYTHCTSGASTCPSLNKDFFSGRDMQVKKFKENLSDAESKELEKILIEIAGRDLYNVAGNTLQRQGLSSYSCPRKLFRANGVIAEDGSIVSFTQAEKMLYIYFLDKLVYNKKTDYLCVTMDEISKELCLEKKTVLRGISKFLENKILEAFKDKKKTSSPWNYMNINANLTYWVGTPSDYTLL